MCCAIRDPLLDIIHNLTIALLSQESCPMFFAVYKLCWDPSDNKNEEHIAFYVETGEEEVTRTEGRRRVTEKMQKGLLFHATDKSKKIIQERNTQFIQFEFESKSGKDVCNRKT